MSQIFYILCILSLFMNAICITYIIKISKCVSILQENVINLQDKYIRTMLTEILNKEDHNAEEY